MVKLQINHAVVSLQQIKKTSDAQLRAVKRYYEKNKHHILNRNNNYYIANKEAIIKNKVEYMKNRYNTDPIYRKKMQQYHLNYYYNNKLLLQEKKEQLNILTAQ